MRDSIKKRRKANKHGICSIASTHPKPSLSKRIRRRVLAKTETAPPGAKQQLDNEERLVLIVRRAVFLHEGKGKPYRVIVQQLKNEFKLAKVPATSTLCRWMKLGKAEFMEDINDMRKQLRLEQFNECEELKRQWWDAASRKILVARHRMVDGEKIEIIDENAFNEQAMAAMVYLKLMERQAKLLGLDLAGNEGEKEKQRSPQEIYLLISKMLQQEQPQQGKDVSHFGNIERSLDSGKTSDI